MSPPAPAAPTSAPAKPGVTAFHDEDELAYGSDVHEAIAQSFHAPPSNLAFLEMGPSGPYNAQHSFPHALSELRDQLDAVLRHQDDPEELEHQAILFWPSLSRLHPWLGKGRRESELITHFDMLRAQFRLQPVTATVLNALRVVLHKSATAFELNEDLVDECLDLLEAAGADLRLPLSFGGPHED